MPILKHQIKVTPSPSLPVQVMVKEGTLPFLFDKTRAARFGVLPRYAKDASEIRWFETDSMMAFHVVSELALGPLVQ